jgi:hypothetical protein
VTNEEVERRVQRVLLEDALVVLAEAEDLLRIVVGQYQFEENNEKAKLVVRDARDVLRRAGM